MTTTATIKSKGCNATGIDETLAKRCHDSLGRKVLAVVELQADSRTENTNGDESVSLRILTIEPAPNAQTEDHLRELARSFYYERQLAEGQAPSLPLAGESSEPDLADVVAAGAKHKAHPYLASTLSTDDNAVCDVCGLLETAPAHRDYSAMADPFTLPDDQDDDPDEDEGDIELDEDEPDAHEDFHGGARGELDQDEDEPEDHGRTLRSV